MSFWFAALLLCFCVLLPFTGRAATNDLTTLLQQGLFEEQANRNLDAAIVSYQTLAAQFDKDRQLAATAVFRLGECYRALGKTNEAAVQYQRILHDFSDQTTLATLSRQNLAGMGMATASTTTTSSSAGMARQRQLLTDEINIVEQQLESQQKQVKAGVLSTDSLLSTQQKLLELKRQLVALDSGQPVSVQPGVSTDEEEQEIQRIKTMIQNSPDLINARRGPGGTPLVTAARFGWLKVAAYLLEHGADINAGGGEALIEATRSGNRAMVEFLLSHGANVNSKDESKFPGALGQTPLHIAVSSGFKAVTEVLLANKADVNAQYQNGVTPLMSAVIANHAEVVKMLLDAGANPNQENNDGRTPLSFAVESGSPEIVKMLLAAKADPNGGKLDVPLLVAIHKNDVAVAELLLQAGANPNAKGTVDLSSSTFSGGNTRFSVTPLSLAVSTAQLPMVQLLLKYKADPNDSQTDGRPLLFSALSKTNVLEALLDAGAKIDAFETDQNGNPLWTPLGSATASKNASAVEVLLKHGANPDAHNPGGYTPLHIAAYNLAGSNIFKLLLEAKADPNVRDKDGNTPLGVLKAKLAANGVTAEQKITASADAELLRQHGALDNLPDWDRISISRPAANVSEPVFLKNTNDWNHFTLLELLLQTYPNPGYSRGSSALTKFPDLSGIMIVRPSTNGAGLKRIPVNLLNPTNGVDCSRDMPLEFGDVVEIPEREHTLAEGTTYLTRAQTMEILDYFRQKAGEVKLVVSGAPTVSLPLQPMFSQIGTVLTKADARAALTSKSDLSRVKVIRHDPKTGKKLEWILDCASAVSGNGNNAPDLWLRDGDVIELPEKP